MFDEIPYHFRDKNESRKIKQLLSKDFFEGKETKRKVDYRKALILACIYFQINYPTSEITIILETLAEIQHLLYQQESSHSKMSVLRHYVQTFIHSIYMRKVFGKPKHMRKRRLFGKYFHAISAHSCHILRIFNGRSINTENEERMFTSIKNLAKETTNKQPDNIISNVFIRYQLR